MLLAERFPELDGWRREFLATDVTPTDIPTSELECHIYRNRGSLRHLLDEALADYLLNWEKSNYATVIYYCNATIEGIQNAQDDTDFGNAIHAYAEGVGFTHGFRRISNKMITDAEIDGILSLLKAPAGQTPESYRFLNEPALLADLQTIIDDIQAIYGFTDEEVTSYFVNNNP